MDLTLDDIARIGTRRLPTAEDLERALNALSDDAPAYEPTTTA